MTSIKRASLALIVLAFIIIACANVAPTPQTDEVSVIVEKTFQALTAAAPDTQGSGIPVSFQNVTFTIPNGLANGATAEIVPASGEDGAPWDMGPEHIIFTLSGYGVSHENEAITPFIWVYPAAEFASINPGASKSIPKLQALLASPSMPINTETAPHVPFYNAAQALVAQGGIIQFQNGAGVRMISHYTQFISPITQKGQMYHFEGLTSDGKYYVIAVFPIASPLQSTSDNPSADGVSFPDAGTASQSDIDAYYQAMTAILNTSNADAFQPSINQLDALIQSISITP